MLVTFTWVNSELGIDRKQETKFEPRFIFVNNEDRKQKTTAKDEEGLKVQAFKENYDALFGVKLFASLSPRGLILRIEKNKIFSQIVFVLVWKHFYICVFQLTNK